MSQGKQFYYTELTPEQLGDIVRSQTGAVVEPILNRMEQLEEALCNERPAFDREMAARYCNKSVTWIDNRHRTDNLPKHHVGGSPYFKKEDLDHLLSGGVFTEDGTPVFKTTLEKKTG